RTTYRYARGVAALVAKPETARLTPEQLALVLVQLDPRKARIAAAAESLETIWFYAGEQRDQFQAQFRALGEVCRAEAGLLELVAQCLRRGQDCTPEEREALREQD